MFWVGNRHFVSFDDYEHRHMEVDSKRIIPDELKSFLSNIVDPSEVQKNNSEVLHSSGDFNNAIIEYSDRIKNNSATPRDYFNRGVCYLETKRIDEAYSDFSAVIMFEPLNLAARYNRITISLMERSYSKIVQATKDLSTILDHETEDRMVYFLRGYCYFLLRNDKLAYADWEIAKQRGLTDTDSEVWKSDYQEVNLS